MFDFSSVYTYLLIAVVIAVAAYYFYNNKKNKRSKPIAATTLNEVVGNEVVNVEMVPAIVVDSVLGTWSHTDVKKSIVEDLRKAGPVPVKNYDGKDVYYLNYFAAEDGSYHFRTMESLKKLITKENSSRGLYNDLQQPEVKLAMKELAKSDQKNTLQDFMRYLPWIAALFFIGFLFAFS